MKFETDRFTIKGLVNGKVLYAVGCSAETSFEELV